jgi:hypothetical protein
MDDALRFARELRLPPREWREVRGIGLSEAHVIEKASQREAADAESSAAKGFAAGEEWGILGELE